MKINVLRYISIFLFLVISISSAKEVTYQDDMGRIVKIPIPVKRAVFIMTPELIPALNLWDRVVGISRWAYEENKLLKALKAKWKDTIVSVGGAGQDVNIEVLLKLKPDLVITWSYYPEVVRFIESKGLRVIAIYPHTRREFYDLINLYGKVFEKEKEAKRTIEEMERIFKLVEERVEKIPVNKKRKVLWLYGKPTRVACKGGMAADVLNKIEAINPAYNITKASPGGSVEVSIERMIAWNPDVLFIWGRAKYNADDILNNLQFRHIKAVKDGRVYKAPEDWSTWAPGLAPLTLWVASKTYPEYFKDIDLEKICDDFYRKVFGISYRKVKSNDN